MRLRQCRKNQRVRVLPSWNGTEYTGRITAVKAGETKVWVRLDQTRVTRYIGPRHLVLAESNNEPTD